MSDEKKKRSVKSIVAIVVALVLATGAMAFSVWRCVVSIQKKFNRDSEPTKTTTETRTVTPSFGGGTVYSSGEAVYTDKITLTKGSEDYNFVLNVPDLVYANEDDEYGYTFHAEGGFTNVRLYFASINWLASSDFPTVPELTDDCWQFISADLSDIRSLPLSFNMLKGASDFSDQAACYCSNENLLPSAVSDYNEYVMFVVVPLQRSDVSVIGAEGTYLDFRSCIYRLSDLVAMSDTSSGGSGSGGGYTQADLEAARKAGYEFGYSEGFEIGKGQGVIDYIESDGYKKELKDEYDRGYAAGNEDYDIYGAQRYQDGLIDGRAKAQNDVNTGKSLFLSILDAPFQLIRNIFNFEILGINISSVIFFVISVLLIGFVIRKIKG